MTGLSQHVHFQAQHALVSFENPFPQGCHGADHALAEGLDESAASRVFGFRQATITTWLARAGEHAQALHKHYFRTLRLPHLQLDELRTRLRRANQILWLWLAIDPHTKLLPVLQLGPRTQNMAHAVIHSLRRLLAPGCIPLFTSDGLNLYFYALTAHFGQWQEVVRRGRYVRRWQVEPGLIYGQVKKSYRQRKLVRVTHVMRLGTAEDLTRALQAMGFSGRLNTAFIERVNLTIRHGIAALAHRTWATAKPASCLLSFCTPPCSAAGEARAAAKTRGQPSGATLSAADPSHGSRQNPSTVDNARGALLPLAKAFRLRASKPDGEMYHVAGRLLNVPPAGLGWSLTLGREGQSGPSNNKHPAQSGLGGAG